MVPSTRWDRKDIGINVDLISIGRWGWERIQSQPKHVVIELSHRPTQLWVALNPIFNENLLSIGVIKVGPQVNREITGPEIESRIMRYFDKVSGSIEDESFIDETGSCGRVPAEQRVSA